MSALDVDTLLDLLVRLNANDQSVDDIANWLDELSALLGGAFVAITELRGEPPQLGRQLTSALDPALAERWTKHCPYGLPWWEALLAKVGRFVDVSEHVPASTVAASPVHADFFTAGGFDPGAVLALYASVPSPPPHRGGGAMWTVIGRRPFRPDEVEFCRRLAPHLFLAMKRRGDFHYLAHRFAIAHEAASNSPTGLMLLAEDCTVLWKNTIAESLLAESDGVTVDGHTLVGRRTADTLAIQRHVAAWRERIGEPTVEAGLLPIARAGRRPLGLYFRPSPPMAAAATDAVALCAMLDPEQLPVPSRKLIQKLFGLTEAESRLAVSIASGETPKELADRTERSLETVRTQLKFVFRKLGVRRQIDLVRIPTKESLSRRSFAADAEDAER